MVHILLTVALGIQALIPNLLLVSPPKLNCPTLPEAQTTIKVNVPSDAYYRVWLRQITPADSKNLLYIQVDDNCARQIAKNLTADILEWVSVDNQNAPLVWKLAEGEHTIKVAGSHTSSAVDTGLFTARLNCIPTGDGENCPVEPEQTAPSDPVPGQGNLLAPILLVVWIALFLGTLVYLARRYHIFLRPALKANGLKWYRHAFLLSTLSQFVRHHRYVVAVCGSMLIVLLVALAVGVVVLAASSNRFEAENGELSGGAKIVQNQLASNSAFVAFDEIPPQIIDPNTQTGTPSSPAPTNNNGNNNPGGGNNDPGSGNNNPGGGNNDPTPDPDPTTPVVGECPAFPAFPDENCTGWEHTGVTLTNCDYLLDGGNGEFWIWDDNPVKTYDSCYFSGNITVQAAGVTITRSQIHGAVSPHWSSNYSLRGLTVRDVEIEQEGLAVPRVAISGNDWSCKRCDVHHGVSGMHFGDNTQITDSYVHDMQWLEGSHGSGIATGQDHGSNSVISHNNIQCNRVNGPPICSSALSIYPEDDNGDGITVRNVNVEYNLFNATGAYCVYAVSIPGSNINFRNNVFGKKFYPGCAGYGPVTGYGPAGGEWINNVWADGSGPVTPS